MSDSGLIIEHLNLRLPDSLSTRANGIGRELAKQLGNIELQHSLQVDSLVVPSIQLHGGECNQVIARKIASGVKQQLSHQLNKGT